ncbi:Hypothetical predicted protein, partial [Pelobates cultripes]
RPIVSAIGGVLEPLAQWLDYLFKDTVVKLPTCIKDTPDLLKLLDTINLPNTTTLLVTCDVKSLYTIIPHLDGIEAMRKVLQDSTTYTGPPIEYVMEILEAVLTLNYFRFEETWYQQIAGTSMGAAMAPMYANSFMYIFETLHILQPYEANILFYRRFIDVFLIWKGDHQSILEMIEAINRAPTP